MLESISIFGGGVEGRGLRRVFALKGRLIALVYGGWGDGEREGRGGNCKEKQHDRTRQK